MKHYLTFLALFTCLLIWFIPCRAQKIYQVMYDGQCDVRVFMVEEKSQCDLVVFFVDEEEKAKKDGNWFVCDFPDNAEVKIYFVDEESRADIKIYITENESEAGWINEDKKELLK